MSKARFSFQIEGADELDAKLRQLGAQINTGEVLEEAMMEGAEIVRSSVAAQAPNRTGQLAGNITISERGRKDYSLRIGPSGRGFYGRFLEYGTSKMSARPFVRPGFDSARGAAQQSIQESIWRAVQDAI